MTRFNYYPVGVQSFSEIRENGYLYIDKTEYIYNMTHSPARYYFLSRPRRFGKTLLTDTLHCFFDGRKELFEGLAIDRLEKEWKKYPVLHFDLSRGKGFTAETLTDYIHSIIAENESRLNLPKSEERNINIRLSNLIVKASEKYKSQVVVLVDEYDAPLLDVAHDDDMLKEMRNIMRNFYSPLKGCYQYLRFVFLTGITKFSQVSIFSELNNIVNISMLPQYAAICGITEDELHGQMHDDVAHLAESRDVTVDEMYAQIKEYYDGYHFCHPSPDIYNPYSLLQALDNGLIRPYWFESGTPTFLVEMLRKYHTTPLDLNNMECLPTDFDTPTERMGSIVPLLYQSGYITIKGYSQVSDLYSLSIPNKEVRIGLMRSLLPNYVSNPPAINTLTAKMAEHLYYGRVDEALQLMQDVLDTIPYCDSVVNEGHFHQLLYLMLTLMGFNTQSEVRTSKGRIDMAMTTNNHIYLIELKINSSAQAALDQIDQRQYDRKFALDRLPITKIGINFSTEQRNITDWKITNSDE